MKRPPDKALSDGQMKATIRQSIFRLHYKADRRFMQQPIENRMVIDSEWPEEKLIPDGVSGYYEDFDQEFVPDEDAFEYALENWDMMPMDKRQIFKQDLVDLFFDNWRRIEGD